MYEHVYLCLFVVVVVVVVVVGLATGPCGVSES